MAAGLTPIPRRHSQGPGPPVLTRAARGFSILRRPRAAPLNRTDVSERNRAEHGRPLIYRDQDLAEPDFARAARHRMAELGPYQVRGQYPAGLGVGPALLLMRTPVEAAPWSP